MKVLIDGYNLLQAAGLFGSAAGVGTLASARIVLLDYLVEALGAADGKRMVVVFDAAAAPPGLPSVMDHDGLTVRFSRREGSADELIEELIEAEADPRNLTVVSSDHRVQRAARRRRALPVDSQDWYRELRAKGDRGRAKADGAEAEGKLGAMGLENPFPAGYLEDVEREFGE